MMAKPEVCFVSPHLYPILAPESGISFAGGAEVQQALIARGIIELGYPVSAVTLDYGQQDNFFLNGVRVFKAYPPQAGIKGLRFFHPRLTGLWRALRRANADIYYQRTAGMLTGVVAKFCAVHGKKFVYAGAHDQDFLPGNHGLHFHRDKLLYEWGLRHTDRVVVQNEVQRKALKDNFGIDGIIIHNIGQNSNHHARWRNGKIAWVGVIRPWKAPLRFVELAEKNPEMEFLLIGGAGTIPEQRLLWDKINEKAKNLPNLTLAGHIPRSEMNERLKSVSLLVNTSDKEGFPNTFLEAWARGIPTVSFINVEGESGRPTPGIVVKDENELAAMVQNLMADEKCWEKESYRCRKLFEQHFTFPSVTDKYLDLFN